MKRWIRWNIRCLRGRRCADLFIASGEVPEGIDPDELAGVSVGMEWVCGSCKTMYRREALFVNDGDFVHLDRVRVG